MTPAEFKQYCASIRDTAVWGGEPEILALSRVFGVPIHVVQGGTPPIVMHNPSSTPSDGDIPDSRVVRISYHRRMYGLGEVSYVYLLLDLILIVMINVSITTLYVPRNRLSRRDYACLCTPIPMLYAFSLIVVVLNHE